MYKHLTVHPINHEIFTSYQKCCIPAELYPKSCAPGTLAAITFAHDDRIILARLFRNSSTNYCELDNCVEFADFEKNFGNTSSSVETKKIETIELIQDEVKFDEIVVDLKLTEFDSNTEQAIETVCNILKCYTFSENCVVHVNDRLPICSGIQAIYVRSTQPCGFGGIRRATKVTVNRKHFYTNAIKYQKLGGVDEIKSDFEEIIKGNTKFRRRNQILLAGPSGVGKTSLIHNLVIENSIKLFEIKLTDVLNSHPGETESQLRKIFQTASEFTKQHMDHMCMVLIEDVDQFCPRTIKNSEAQLSARISSQLLTLLDRVNNRCFGQIIVVATTSNIENVELKIRRPGRLEVELFMSLPSREQRADILKVLLNEILVNCELDLHDILQTIGERTPGYVGADVSLLVNNMTRDVLKDRRNFSDLNSEDVLNYLTNGLKKIRPSCLREHINVTNVDLASFDHIGGVDVLKKKLDISILAPLKYPESFARFSLKPPKGILLYGPPGCAKTTMAKYIAARTNMTFISVSSAEIYSPYVGNAEKFLVKIFNKARMSSPAIIFIDEIDALVGNRSRGETKNDVQTRILSTLLTEMDGIGLKVESSSTMVKDNTIIVIAATNRPDMIDDALMRPGRFDKLIHVAAPDYAARLDILRRITSRIPLDADTFDFAILAEQTQNFSGADLFNLCNEAALHALTRDLNTATVKFNDFTTVLGTLKPSLTTAQLEYYNSFEMLTLK